jgi:hypothetical protein
LKYVNLNRNLWSKQFNGRNFLPDPKALQSLREISRKEKAFEKIWELLPEYEGHKLEALIKRIFIELRPFDLDFSGIGRYWDRKGENEIDLAMEDEESNKAYVVD